MSIVRVETVCFRQPMVPIHNKRFAGAQEIVLVSVTDDGGQVGHSMARAHGGQPGRGIADAIERSIAPLLAGIDPLEHERIWQAMMRLDPAGYVPVFAISAVDVAVWDLVGKMLGQPLYKLLGGRSDRIMAYASSAHMESVDDYVRDLERCLARGYRAYKIHPFNHPQRDIELCRLLRREAGDDVKLMLDVAKGYNRTDALKVGRVLEQLGFHWYEEPLPHYDIEGYAALSSALDIAVVGAETVPGGASAVANYLRAGALDMVLCDVYWKAGVTGMLKTAVLCEAMGIQVASHHGASPAMNFANLHVLAGATNADMIEVLVPEEGYDFALASYLAPQADGWIAAPQSPGLGIALDWDYIAANRV
jgi:L-alanine-DL-glutamate epimerase-like enolase superfamily enzyme